jgi:hypothetical protein
LPNSNTVAQSYVMSDVALTETARQPLIPRNRSKQARLSPKLQSAVAAIVEFGQELDEAAATAGMTTHALRVALARPHVIAAVRAAREVFHAYVRAQNIHHARQMRNTGKNEMARLGAMRLIEGDGDQQQRGSAANAPPGVTIRIVNVVQAGQAVAQQRVKTIDADAIETTPDAISEATGRENR